VLREELHEPRHYFAILQAIAQGRTRLNEIVQATGMERGPVSRYLAVLKDLRLVERHVPATERQPDKSRQGLYRLRDPFLAFWFRFVAPYASTLEGGYTAPVARRVEAEMSRFIGPVFEDLCREWVIEQAAAGRLPFLPERIGAWWDRNVEIDLVAASDSEGALLAGECKWSVNSVGTNVLIDLKRKVQPLLDAGPWRPASYILFARAGFTPDLQAMAKAEGVRLVRADELLAA
jgi:AAA+ ATPase superfamily predicted ATPase